jgi:hypothetical protein
MATAYTCVTPGVTPLVCTGVAVAVSGDTISGNDINNGAQLVVTVAATPTTVSFVDPGHTAAGTVAGAVATYTVAANTSKAFGSKLLAGYIDPVAGTVGVLYTSATNATAQVLA